MRTYIVPTTPWTTDGNKNWAVLTQGVTVMVEESELMIPTINSSVHAYGHMCDDAVLTEATMVMPFQFEPMLPSHDFSC